MNWYTAKLIFRVISGDGNHCGQFDEQLRLIKAGNEHCAFEKAHVIGHANEDSFLNIKQETVQWQFIAVTEINQLNELDDCTELYYKLKEAIDPKAYMELVLQRSALLIRSIKNH